MGKTRMAEEKMDPTTKKATPAKTTVKRGSPQGLGWSERVAFSEGVAGGFAYRPRELIARNAFGVDVKKKLEAMGFSFEDHSEDADGNRWFKINGDVDVLAVIEDLRLDGFKAEPNYVFFAHQISANPLIPNPLIPNPLIPNPLIPNPLIPNPLDYLDYRRTGRRTNGASPAEAVKFKPFTGQRQLNIVVLDSGLAGKAPASPYQQNKREQLPALLRPFQKKNSDPELDLPDADGDVTLDPVAGHGTFIAGIIELLAPGCKLNVQRVFKRQGDVSQKDLSATLDSINGDDKMLLNLSFGGYARDDMHVLPQKLRKLQGKGVVVVASAGNDGSSRPLYPACLPGVVSVGALGPYGPAPFTNYGPWVRACAPGVDVVSSFFADFDGPIELKAKAKDPDQFKGWARWSGTSFAAPTVVAALAREMMRTNCTAKEAVERVIDAPGLFRIPGLGTVVNIAWPPAKD